MKPRRNSKSAIALHFDQAKDQAPRVTAKGEGFVAERIIELAREHDIPIREDADLVEVLSQVNVQQEIPPSVYRVVAELLAWVYKMNKEYKIPRNLHKALYKEAFANVKGENVQSEILRASRAPE